jgi:hypothetical protein
MSRRAFVERVDRYEGRRIQYTHRLNEPSAVGVGIGEDGAKGCAAVMISHQQDRRRAKALKRVAENFVGGAITRMNEIAGDDDECYVAVIAIDDFDGAGEPGGGVKPIQQSAGRHQM